MPMNGKGNEVGLYLLQRRRWLKRIDLFSVIVRIWNNRNNTACYWIYGAKNE